jgi:hypothetical protein
MRGLAGVGQVLRNTRRVIYGERQRLLRGIAEL